MQIVTIKFEYDDSYRSHVIENEAPDMWIDTRIFVDGNSLWNSPYPISGSAVSVVLDFLESVEAACSNEQSVIAFYNGPSWVVVEPRTADAVTITHCYEYTSIDDPESRLDIEPSVPVTKRAWAEAVLEVADDFRKTVLNLNPDLRESNPMRTVDEKLTEIEALQ